MYEALIPILAPEFVDDDRMEGALLIAAKQVDLDHCYHDEVVVLLAAHLLAGADRGGTGGAIKSESEGGLSRTFADAGASGDGLGLTSYGQEVSRLNRLCYGLTARTAWGDRYGTSYR